MEKSCGSCTFCCKVMEVPEYNKPIGTWCAYCKPGAGCQAYETRPSECRVFRCQFLEEERMPDNFRPDKTKVILTGADGPSLMANCDPANAMAWRNEPIYSLLKHRAKTHWMGTLAVMARAGNRMWHIGPDADVDLGIVDPRSPVQFDQLPGGGVKVTVLPPASEEAYAARMERLLRDAERSRQG